MSGGAGLIEGRSFDFVPESERSSSLSLQVRFWFMVNATLITAFTGSIGPLFGLGLPASLLAIVTGTLFGTLFQGFHGAQGPHMGLPQMIQSRVQFGSRGAVVPIAVAAVIPLGFSIFYLQTGASAFAGLAGGGVHAPQVAFGVVAVLLAIIGYHWIVRSEGVIAWVMLANLIALTVAVVATLPLGQLLQDSSFSATGFLAQFGAAAGYQIAIAPIVSDYTRYLPTSTSGAKVSATVFIGTVTSAVWIESLGATVSLANPGTDVIAAIRTTGDDFGFSLGTVTMVVAVVVCLVTASVSLYSGTVSLLSAAEAFRPLRSTPRLRAWTLGVTGTVVIVTGLTMPEDILRSFSVFLTLLGYLLIPWTAVNLTDYYIVRRGRYSITDILRPDGGMYGRWGANGLVAYGLGLVAMIPFISTSAFTGPVASALEGADIAFAVGLLVSSVLYLLLMRRVDVDGEQQLVARAPLHTGFLHDALTAEPAAARSAVTGPTN